MYNEKKIKDIIQRKEKYLNVLKEFDKTHKLDFKDNKVRFNFTLDRDVVSKLKTKSINNKVSMSSMIESMLRDNIETNY
jgi:hypothetical protein